MHGRPRSDESRKGWNQTHFMQGEAGHDSAFDLISLKRSAPERTPRGGQGKNNDGGNAATGDTMTRD